MAVFIETGTVKYRYRAHNGISTFTELLIYFRYYCRTLVWGHAPRKFLGVNIINFSKKFTVMPLYIDLLIIPLWDQLDLSI